MGDRAPYRVLLSAGAVIALVSAIVPTPKPERETRYLRPLAQWHCDAQEFREHTYACAHRELGPKPIFTKEKPR